MTPVVDPTPSEPQPATDPIPELQVGEHRRPQPEATGVGPLGTRDRGRKAVAIAFVVAVILVAVVTVLTRSSLFHVRTLRVHGAAHLSRADILRVAAIGPDTNVFTLDADAAERRLERDAWIAEATVTKDLPSTLTVDIDERTVVAVVESGGIARLVADDGVLLEVARPGMATRLPRIASAEEGGAEPIADEVNGAARAIAAMAPRLRERVDVVSILADGQLRVDLSTGAQIAYGEAIDLVEKARALRALLAYADARGSSVTSADVRVPSAPTAELTSV